MTIKITGQNEELFQYFLTSCLNIATVVAQGGHIPTELEIESPERSGRYWFRETGFRTDRFQLYSQANNHWARVFEEGENTIVLTFYYRYDKNPLAFSNTICPLLAAVFPENVEIIP